MIHALIERLRSASAEVRSAAETELSKVARSGTLSLEDADALIQAATGAFPESENEWQDPSAKLLWAARDIARDRDAAALLPQIERAFGRLRPGARLGALQIIVLAGNVAAAEVYLRVLEQHGDQIADGMLAQFEPSAGPEVGAALFPALIGLARNPRVGRTAFYTLLTFRQEGMVPEDIAKPHHSSLVRVLQAELGRARALQKPSGLGWRDEPPYVEHRDMIGLMFDLSGMLSSSGLLRVVESAGDLLDPRLRRFRAITLLRRGRDVPQTELEWIARSARDRYWLFEQLHQMDAAHRLPPDCLDQEKLAEGHMVDWLCFVTELGREPDEIGLIRRETRSASDAHLLVRWLAKRKPVDYFFFKYRVTEEHWSKEKGWMVGMAGGYARADQPTTSHDGGTFSKFEPLDAKSIKGHIADYLG